MVTKLDDGAQNLPLGFQSVGNGGGGVSYVTRANLDRADKIASDANSQVARCFLRLSNLDNGAFDRANRYETALMAPSRPSLAYS